jgi:hypothetical protein
MTHATDRGFGRDIIEFAPGVIKWSTPVSRSPARPRSTPNVGDHTEQRTGLAILERTARVCHFDGDQAAWAPRGPWLMSQGEQGGPAGRSSSSIDVIGCISQAVARHTPGRVAVFCDLPACSKSNSNHPVTRTQ